MKITIIRIIVLAILITFGPLTFGRFGLVQAKTALVVAGSSTVIDTLLAPILHELTSSLQMQIQLRSTGSTDGLRMLLEGSADVAILSTSLNYIKEKMPSTLDSKIHLREYPIGFDRMVIIVNPKNAINKISKEELKAIYIGKIRNWQDVGGQNQLIRVIIPRAGSGTRIEIQEKIMDNETFADSVISTESHVTALGLISKLPGGVGAVSKKLLDLYPGMVRLLDSYELIRPLFCIIREEVDQRGQQFIQFFQKKNQTLPGG